MREAIALLERVSGRRLAFARASVRAVTRDALPPTSSESRDELGWSPTHLSSRTGLKAQWSWAADRVAAR